MKTFRLTFIALSTLISMHTFAQKAPVHPDRTPARQKEVKVAKTTTVRYYYLPEFNAYYDQQTKAYYYKKGSTWRKTSKPTLIGKNITSAKKEPLIGFKGTKPYQKNSEHIQQYGGRR